jgi:hypothetical protein
MRGRLLLAQDEGSQHDPKDADWYVDEKDELPAAQAHQIATEGGSNHWG